MRATRGSPASAATVSAGASRASSIRSADAPGDTELPADFFEGPGWPSARPNRSSIAFFSRSESVWRTEPSCSCRGMKDAASTDHGVGVLDEIAEVRVLLLADGRLQRHRLLGHLLDLPDLLRSIPITLISSGVGSRPRSCSSCRCTRTSLLIVSTMCTGIRIVRAWSAIAPRDRLADHHVAYVET